MAGTLQQCRLAGRDAGLDAGLREVCESRDRSAGNNVVAFVHVDALRFTVERRPHLGVGQHPFGCGQCRARRFQGGACPCLGEAQILEDVLADERPGVQVSTPLQFAGRLPQVDLPAADRGLCLVASDACALVVQPDQHLPAGDGIAGFDRAPGHSPGRLGCYRDRSKRLHDAGGRCLQRQIGRGGGSDPDAYRIDQRRRHGIVALRAAALAVALGNRIVAARCTAGQPCRDEHCRQPVR